MALAIPGGAPGYDDDKQFGNFIAHITARTSQRLREHSGEPPKVKGRRRSARLVQSSRVPGISRAENAGSGHVPGLKALSWRRLPPPPPPSAPRPNQPRHPPPTPP